MMDWDKLAYRFTALLTSCGPREPHQFKRAMESGRGVLTRICCRLGLGLRDNDEHGGQQRDFN